LAVHSSYIARPNGYDIEWRLQEVDAAKAKPLAESVFTAAPANDQGWTHEARLLGSGLYRVALKQGHFYRFSSSNEWSFNLTVHDEAGYQLYAGLNEPDRIGSLGQLSFPLLAVRDGVVFVKVDVGGGAESNRVDLLIETSAASRAAEAYVTVDLGRANQAATAPAAFFGEPHGYAGPGGHRITGKPFAANTIYGGTGSDVIELKTQANKTSVVDGWLGSDTLIVGFPSSEAKLVKRNAYGPFRHLTPQGRDPDAHALMGSPDGAALILRSIEFVQFSDKTLQLKDLPGF